MQPKPWRCCSDGWAAPRATRSSWPPSATAEQGSPLTAADRTPRPAPLTRWLRALSLLLAFATLPLASAQEQADPLLAEQLAELARAADYLERFELPEVRIEPFLWPVEGPISSRFGWRN